MTRRMTRAEQTALTTERIFSAIRTEILERGWDGVTISGIAKQAGVTVGAIYSRSENASELANLKWTERLLAPFESIIATLVDAARSGSVEEFASAASAFDAYAEGNSIVFDLAMASLFDEELGEVVHRDIARILSDHIHQGQGGTNSPTHSAATALLLFFFMGRALAIRARGRAIKLGKAQISTISGYWSAPESRIRHSDVAPVLFVRQDHADPTPDMALLRGVIEVLSKWGYRRATISRIARATGMTPGAVLAAHGTKAALVQDAASTLVNSPAEVWHQYAPVIENLGPLRARAAFLAAFLDPIHSKHWKLNIELARVAESIPELSSFKTPNNTLEHTHLGVMFVACFVDGLADLPFDGPFTVGSAT